MDIKRVDGIHKGREESDELYCSMRSIDFIG